MVVAQSAIRLVQFSVEHEVALALFDLFAPPVPHYAVLCVGVAANFMRPDWYHQVIIG
jgi:hypothetical protein